MMIWWAITTGRRIIALPSTSLHRMLATNVSSISNRTRPLMSPKKTWRPYMRTTIVAVVCNLWHTTAEEGDNISKHLSTLKKYWEHLNLVEDSSFEISEVQFKITIISSLLPSWGTFTSPYASVHKGDSTDLKLLVTSRN